MKPKATDSIRRLLQRRKRSFEKRLGKTPLHPLSARPYTPPNPYPEGVEERALAAFTKRTKVKLPADVREWLTISNGPPGFFGVRGQRGCDIEEAWKDFPNWRLNDWIPVGRDANGNFFVRVADKSEVGAVYFVDTGDIDELAYAVASDTLHFVLFSLEHDEVVDEGDRYGWPFDKKFVLSKDPGMANVETSRFPWS